MSLRAAINLGDGNDGGRITRSPCGRWIRVCRALGPACGRRPLHGDDRQPAIRLDAVRQSDRSKISLGHCRHPVGFQHLYRDRNVAGAHRGLVCRSVWSPRRGRLGRRLCRLRVGSEFGRWFAVGIVRRCRVIGYRCRRGLRDLRRQCAEMVSRFARPCGWFDCSRLRRRHGCDRHPDPRDDTRVRLPIRIPLVWPRARFHHSVAVAVVAGAAGR